MIKSVLIIGSGPIIIGQACEFDYSGTQACMAFKQEGIRTILLNSNPATIMTDPSVADVVYIEPITLNFLEKIIFKERPDAILPTVGGQVALNAVLELHYNGILDKYNIKLIGTSIDAIELTENRKLFQELVQSLGYNTPSSIFLTKADLSMLGSIDFVFPALIRTSFSLGGSGSCVVNSRGVLEKLISNAFDMNANEQITVDKCLVGWKEYELEVIRDKVDNCIVVCSIENIDPIGVHTGDSITVAPILTLTDKEYQKLRNAAFDIIRTIGIETGGANIQFAVDSVTGQFVVIEMNPRVSRSSALASKATGFPIARVAALLALGYSLDKLPADIVGAKIPVSFEPSVDYIAVKIPKFNFEKFLGVVPVLGTKMQSIGEALALGCTFKEAIQKAIRSIEIDKEGFDEMFFEKEAIFKWISIPNPYQLFAIADAFRIGIDINKVFTLTKIDCWFLNEIKEIITLENKIKHLDKKSMTPKLLRNIKQSGFSDKRIANLMKLDESKITELRIANKIKPSFKRVDSCAGEFKTETCCLYATYDEFDEILPSLEQKKKVIIIGSGPNRIGQGVEFDCSCVQAIEAFKKLGIETVIINSNPETVSTDFLNPDRLYFSALTAEEVIDICLFEKPTGVLVCLGGQSSLNLANSLSIRGIPLLDLNLQQINLVEDRAKFSNFIQLLGLNYPKTFFSTIDVQFPIIMRPSFVIGGSAMIVLNSKSALDAFFLSNTSCHQVLLEEYLDDALEVDIDLVFDGYEIIVAAIMEHIEPLGVHSGDSAFVFPTVSINILLISEIRKAVYKVCNAMQIKGLCNIQIAIKDNKVYFIEINPRASRSLPFISKATGVDFIDLAVQVLMGNNTKKYGFLDNKAHFFIKQSVLPFKYFTEAKINLGPEMKSTGEVMAYANCPYKAFIKAQLAVGFFIKMASLILVDACVLTRYEVEVLNDFLSSFSYPVKWVFKDASDIFHINGDIIDFSEAVHIIKQRDLAIFVSIGLNKDEKNISENSFLLREYAEKFKVFYTTTHRGLEFFIKGLMVYDLDKDEPASIDCVLH